MNAEKAMTKDLLPYIAKILNESTWEQDRYINLLRTVEYISMQIPEAANEFMDKFVHINLLKNIRVISINILILFIVFLKLV